MQVQRAATAGGRAATLRSAQSPQHMAAVEVALALVLLQCLSVVAAAASAQKV